MQCKDFVPILSIPSLAFIVPRIQYMKEYMKGGTPNSTTEIPSSIYSKYYSDENVNSLLNAYSPITIKNSSDAAQHHYITLKQFLDLNTPQRNCIKENFNAENSIQLFINVHCIKPSWGALYVPFSLTLKPFFTPFFDCLVDPQFQNHVYFKGAEMISTPSGYALLNGVL